MEEKKHPHVAAWNKWLESDEGQRCVEPTGIKMPKDQRQYLENRLQAAFRAGMRSVADLAGKDTTDER